MMLWSRTFLALFLATQVLFGVNAADNRRPVWNIAHMVNALYQVDHYLQMGANGLEFDIVFTKEGTAQYTFHGFPCDCFRSCMQYEDFTTFLKYLRRVTTPGESLFRKELVLLFMDFKVAGLYSEALTKAGEDVALKLLDFYWMGGNSKTEAYIMVSLPSTQNIEFMESFQRTLHSQNASEYLSRIGLDFSGNEDVFTIQRSLERSQFHGNNWLGDGITNCLGRSTKRLLAALSEREKQHKKISKVYWWTVDRKNTMRRVISLGVDAMITNYPENLFSVLKEDAFNQQVRLATFVDSPWEKHEEATERLNSFQEENSTFNEKLLVEEFLYN